MPETQERITLGDRRTPKYRSEPHVARYQFTTRWIQPGMTVLDIACGTGYGAAALAARDAARIVGIDRSREAAGYARSHYGANTVEFAVGDATRCCINEAKIDAVVCMEAIEHFEDVEAFLGEMTRVIKPGGLFLVSTPNKLFHSPHSDSPLNPFHIVEYTLRGFQELLAGPFAVDEMFGQQPQNVARTAAQRWSPPPAVRRLLLALPFVQSYFSAGASTFVTHDIEACRFFFAVCRNLP